MDWHKIFDEWKWVILIIALVMVFTSVTILALQGQDSPRLSEEEVIAFIRYEIINMELVSPDRDITIEAEYAGDGQWTGIAEGSYFNTDKNRFSECRITWSFYEERLSMGIVDIDRER
ncbi:MAG: hypothetical protein JSW16_04295 [Dehalococcoidales bacterium]|nr:MAG: hypothetical protein JSW16_04295 [Dehalococcoidales bacterium]